MFLSRNNKRLMACKRDKNTPRTYSRGRDQQNNNKIYPRHRCLFIPARDSPVTCSLLTPCLPACLWQSECEWEARLRSYSSELIFVASCAAPVKETNSISPPASPLSVGLGTAPHNGWLLHATNIHSREQTSQLPCSPREP